jgi:hypothetical protein
MSLRMGSVAIHNKPKYDIANAMPYDVTAVRSRAAGVRTVATWVGSG